MSKTHTHCPARHRSLYVRGSCFRFSSMRHGYCHRDAPHSRHISRSFSSESDGAKICKRIATGPACCGVTRPYCSQCLLPHLRHGQVHSNVSGLHTTDCDGTAPACSTQSKHVSYTRASRAVSGAPWASHSAIAPLPIEALDQLEPPLLVLLSHA